ncbi:hypothetical protein [Enterobacter sp. A4]|uniref:hypothetical protein n=1 Tax=Enterobacter TaxID=547 RepID=UPI003D224D36
MKEKICDEFIDISYTVPIEVIEHRNEDLSLFLQSDITRMEVKEFYDTQSSYFMCESYINDSKWHEWASALENIKLLDDLSHQEFAYESNECNSSLVFFENCTQRFDNLCNITHNLSVDFKDSGVFLEYIKNAITRHKEKVTERRRELSHEHLYTAAKSFMEFLRYVPAFSVKRNIKVYIDDKTGYFGIIYKKSIHNAGTLNILVKDNFEIDFSYARKRKGVITITGIAKFGKHHENSDQILSLFRLME